MPNSLLPVISITRGGVDRRRHRGQLDRRRLVTNVLDELCAALEQDARVVGIALDELHDRLGGAHDHRERTLLRAGHLHLPLHLRLIAFDDDRIERLAPTDVLAFDRALQLIDPAVERADRPIVSKVRDDIAATADRIAAALRSYQSRLSGSVATPSCTGQTSERSSGIFCRVFSSHRLWMAIASPVISLPMSEEPSLPVRAAICAALSIRNPLAKSTWEDTERL